MSDDEKGAFGGTQTNFDELLPQGKTFKDPDEELQFWKQLAWNHKKSHRRLSDQLNTERQSMNQMRGELDQLKEQIQGFTQVEANRASREREQSSKVSASASSQEEASGSNRQGHSVLGTIPKLTIFTGDEGKNEYPYLSWRFDVQQLIYSGYSPGVVRMAINRSCRGTASTAIQTLGQHFQPDDVIAAFDKRFASVETSESLKSKFYSATQKADESANTWGCRLEAFLTRPQFDNLRHTQKESMLRERFWRGLRSLTERNALRHRFDTGATYEELLVCAREVESETPKPSSNPSSSKPPKKAQVSQAQSSDDKISSTLSDILARLTALEKTMQPQASKDSKQPFKKKSHQQDKKTSGQGETSTDKKVFCFKCKKEGHYRNKCPDLKEA